MKPKHVLLINNNEREIILTTKAFKESNIDINFTVLKDGTEGLNFIEKNIDSTECNTVDLVLLDINLQNSNGLEVLRKLKRNELFRKTIVIMFTSSSSHKDIETAYLNHCNGYIRLPKETTTFNEIVTKIIGFWLKTTVIKV